MRFLQKLSIGFLIFVIGANSTFAWFDDVGDELAPNVIEFLQENGVGESTQKFYPRRPIELAEFLAMGLALAGVAESDLPAANTPTRFTDISSADWFARQVAFAEELGILASVKGDRLVPRRTLRKGEATALGLKIFGIGVAPATDTEEFGFDDLRPSHRLFREISRALKMGVIEPTSDSNFGMMERFTRADAANLFFELANFHEGSTIIIRNGISSIPNWMLFEAIWKQIESKFLFEENIDESKMMYSALDGLVDSLGDPYSDFLPPEETAATTGDLDGEFEGIGAYLSVSEEGEVLVVSPIAGSPAEAAGVKAGDIIIGVDGQSIQDFSSDQAAKLIRGPAGSTVELTIRRDGAERKISVTRAKVTIKSVETIFQNNVAIVKIAQFTAPTVPEFATAAAEIVAHRPSGIILDLRNNGGGLVNSAVAVMSHFLPKNGLVASQKHRAGLENRDIEYRTSADPDLNNFKIVVLVNRGTASASEIVAAALRDNDLATIVGETTFGKGTVQEINFFADGTALKMTVARWLSPNEEEIQGVGIAPDVEVVDDEATEKDEPLEKALSLF